MKVFVTGATGFIGFATVKELIGAGHQVTGLARTAASAKRLSDIGAQAIVGLVEDLDVLRRAAAAAEGAVHTAFYHKISHIPLASRLRVLLGGSPTAIVSRFLRTAVDMDRQTIETIGRSLARGSPLVAPFGTLALPQGKLATEDSPFDPTFFGAPRARTEDTLRQLAANGIRTSAIRLPPMVHGLGDHGFAPQLEAIARKRHESAYVDAGTNRWPAVHQLDAARLFRLALENGPPGGTYHGVAEEGIPFREIADLIGRRLNVPVVSRTRTEATKRFGFLAPFVSMDNPTSSRLTRERLGWQPTERGLLVDLAQDEYFSK